MTDVRVRPVRVVVVFVGTLMLTSAELVASDARAMVPGGLQSSPIKVMTMGEFEVPASNAKDAARPAGVRARFVTVNAKGGIADDAGVRHKVQVIVCNTMFDADEAERCAHEAVERGVAAVVGMSVVNSDRVWPVLEGAGIAVIGPALNRADDAISPVSFPVGSGTAGLLYGMPQLLARQGAEKIGILVSDFGASTDGVVGLIENGLRLTSASEGPVVRVPQNETDLEPFVDDVTAEGVDGVVSFLAGRGEALLLEELEASGFRGKHVTQTSFITSRLLYDMLRQTNETLVVGQFAQIAASAPGITRFREDMRAFDPDVPSNEGALNSWIAAWVFERVAKGLDTIDARAVLDAMGELENLPMAGLTPPLTTVFDPENLPLLPRLFNPTVTFNQVDEGVIEPLSERFFDPFEGRFQRLPGSLP